MRARHLLFKTEQTIVIWSVVILCLIFAGCGGGGEDVATDGTGNESNEEVAVPPSLDGVSSIRGIPVQEFLSLTPPAYATYQLAFEKVTSDNPALLDDEDALARAIFDELKAVAQSEIRNKDLGIITDLTLKEWIVVLFNPVNAYDAFPTRNQAVTSANDQFPCDVQVGSFADSKLDALRHAYWNALMVRRAGSDFAERFATAHESASDNENATAMDLHNNAYGRAIANTFPTATDANLLEILRKERYLLITSPSDIPENFQGLVFYANASSLEGTLVGTLTNPDAETTWSTSFDVTSCGSEVQGQYTVRDGDFFSVRRFQGTWEAPNMRLTVNAPYSFETRPNSTPCRNVQITLRGDANALVGFWTSISCPLGGEIILSRPSG